MEEIIGGNQGDWATSVKTTIDGGYIVVGLPNSYGNATTNSVYVIKPNYLGDTLINGLKIIPLEE